MLGDKIGEERGKTTGMRVLPGDDFRHVKLESSFQASGTLLGIQGTDIGTYVSWERVTGQMYAEGQGIFITNDGESTIWNGHGVGRPIGEGMGVTFRFSVAFQAGQGKLARLNGVLVIGEHATDSNDNVHTVTWEWK